LLRACSRETISHISVDPTRGDSLMPSVGKSCAMLGDSRPFHVVSFAYSLMSVGTGPPDLST
jgi:hypothetical protein